MWGRVFVSFWIGCAAHAAANDHAREASRAKLDAAFDSAAREFDVPADLLRAIAFVETRWNQVVPEEAEEAGERARHQRVYGIMGLRDDDWFGHSLQAAARLIARSPEELKLDPIQNIRGAAALLREMGQATQPVPGYLATPSARFGAWVEPVIEYCGIPDRGDALTYAQDVFRVLRDGHDGHGIWIPSHASVSLPRAADGEPIEVASPDFPGAVWDRSPNYDAGASLPRFVVIHTTQGSFAGAVSWLKNPRAKVSAHFVIRSIDGYVKQLVRDRDTAWHARCWNRYAIGIEHEGFVSQPEYYTPELYESSAKLSKHLADKHGIPVDSTHIFGHEFWSKPEFKGSPIERLAGPCNSHTDPGMYWDWARYLSLVATP